jgi:hypothetical protein
VGEWGSGGVRGDQEIHLSFFASPTSLTSPTLPTSSTPPTFPTSLLPLFLIPE